MSDDTSEYPIKRDGQRRQSQERRHALRAWSRARRLFGYASGLAAIFYCLNTLRDYGKGAVDVAVNARLMSEQVSAIATKQERESQRTDTLVANQGLMGSHLAKLDTISLEEQRAIQTLTARLDKMTRGRR